MRQANPRFTERLCVRDFELQDAAAIYRLSREAAMRRFIPDQAYRDEEHARSVLEFLIDQYAKPKVIETGTFVRAVTLRESGQVIGHVGLSPVDAGQEIGYAIGKKHQGCGYATELVCETVRWALGERGLSRILAVVSADNLASIRVLYKAGFSLLVQREGMMHGRETVVRTYQASAE